MNEFKAFGFDPDVVHVGRDAHYLAYFKPHHSILGDFIDWKGVANGPLEHQLALWVVWNSG